MSGKKKVMSLQLFNHLKLNLTHKHKEGKKRLYFSCNRFFGAIIPNALMHASFLFSHLMIAGDAVSTSSS